MKPHAANASDRPAPISEDDVIQGMRELQGYFDMTPHDFNILYQKAYALARSRLLRENKAENVMKNPAVAAKDTDSVEALIVLLAERGISGAPVVDASGFVVGVVSEKDVLSALGKKPEAGAMELIRDGIGEPFRVPQTVLQKKVREIMSSPAVAVAQETPLTALAVLFGQKRINRIPVTDENGLLAGIITRADMLDAMSRLS